jgi:hypothetical protein
MPRFRLRPLTSESPLAPIDTLQALGETALEFAVHELWASDDKVPAAALEMIQQEPEEASELIVRKIAEKLSQYQYIGLPAPRGLNNSLIVLATLHQPSSAYEILGILGSDFGDSLLENSLDLIPKALGETIPDLAAWTDLFNEYRESDEYNWARATTLIEALPFIVHRTSVNRSEAAQQLIKFFDRSSEELAVTAALPTVLTLLTLVVPETLPDVLRINQQGPREERIPETQIRAVFADPEGSLNVINAETEAERLSDAVACFQRGPDYPPRHDMPETIEAAIALLENKASDPTSVINANRRFALEPEKAVPALIDYVKSKLHTKPLDDDDDDGFLQSDESQFGAAHAVRMLLELRCTEILPLLLPAFEVNETDCLPGFEELVVTVFTAIVGQTAPSPEFVLNWTRRLNETPDLAILLLTGLPAMVLEGRADRLKVISILRDLYFELIASDDEVQSEDVANYASQGLLTLGDIDFVHAAIKAARLNADSISHILLLVDESEDLPVAVSTGSELITRKWFLEERLITANQMLYEYLSDLADGDDDSDGLFGYDGDDEDDSWGDDDDSSEQPISHFFDNGPLAAARLNLDLNPSDEPDFDAPGTAPAGTFRNTVKVGRNDPCPCGSGRKYKKCCGN